MIVGARLRRERFNFGKTLYRKPGTGSKHAPPVLYNHQHPWLTSRSGRVCGVATVPVAPEDVSMQVLPLKTPCVHAISVSAKYEMACLREDVVIHTLSKFPTTAARPLLRR